MGAERREVLRVLGAVFGTYRHSDDYRHLQNVPGHCLPLRQLIEYLVSGAGNEVAIHDFRNHPAAAHRITD